MNDMWTAVVTWRAGGTMSVFLMGCHDPDTKRFVTVTKCGNGFDDKTLKQLQEELKSNMTRIKKVRVLTFRLAARRAWRSIAGAVDIYIVCPV